MSRFMNPETWLPIDGIILENAALEVAKNNYNTVVVAGPGAGKTELLAQRACYLLQTNTCCSPRKILAISFKKEAAQNLAERVTRRIGKVLEQRFVSKTYDAFAKNILDRFSKALPEEYEPAKDYQIAIQTRARNDIRTAFNLAGLSSTADVRVNKLNDALVDRRLPIENNRELIKNAWSILLKGSNNFSPSLTFQMISRLAEYIIRTNPLIKESLRLTYSHIFLDEFQDTTDLQYDLFHTCFFNSGSVVTAVGDHKQRIMLWARARKDIFDVFNDDFDVAEKKLIMNHRSAPRLVELQRIFYKILNDDGSQIVTSKKWNSNDGEVYLWFFSDSAQEAIILAEKVKGILEKENLRPTDICVLVKQLPDDYCDGLIKALKKVGIKSRNEGVFQDLLKEEAVILCLSCIHLSVVNRLPDAWIYVNDLLVVLHGLDANTDLEKIASIQQDLKKYLIDIRNRLEEIGSENDLMKLVWSILEFFNLESFKNVFPQYKRGDFLNNLITDICNYLWKEYSECRDWAEAIDAVKGVGSLPIMTVHKSKGLEYNTVIFLGLEDGAFWNFSNQQEEDTCTFFVALSRAIRRVAFTFCNRRQIGTRILVQSRSNINDLYKILKSSGVVEAEDFRKKLI